jgi:hypothetical protein
MPFHTALLVQQFLAEKQLPVFEQPLYYPDLAPCDFHVPEIKNLLEWMYFSII